MMRLALAAALIAIALPAIGQEKDKQLRAYGDYIRDAGFYCPAAKKMDDAGLTVWGNSFKVSCGFDDGTPDLESPLVFRVIHRPGRPVIVEPWKP